MATRELELSAGRVHYRDGGQGPPIVFVHGLLVDGSLWRNVTPRLEDRFRCVVPDWPLGSHATPMRADADLSLRGLARLIAEFLERLSLEDVTLVANDTGGALAQLVAVDHAERLARLVLTDCDAFGRFPLIFKPLLYAAHVPGMLYALMVPMRVRRLRRLPLAFGWLSKRPVPDEVLDAWLRPYFSSREIRRDMRRLLKALHPRETLEAASALGSFKAPVLLAWAPEDRIFPFAHALRLAALLPGARVEEVKDSYAFVPEDQPGQLATLIAEFAAAGARQGQAADR